MNPRDKNGRGVGRFIILSGEGASLIGAFLLVPFQTSLNEFRKLPISGF